MKNKGISELFSQIAELLSLGDENIFKIRAYERAAQVIAALPDPIEDIAAKGGLREIPGIGAGISEKINEYLSSGKITYLQELKNKFPQGLLDIMSVPGMGPKKAKILFDKLKIDGIPSLEKAAKEGKIRGLAGFGEKTEENILKGISFKKTSGGRILLNEALGVARAVTAGLEKNKNVKRISPAGSLRRRKETIGDVDILCSAAEGTEKQVVEYFTKLPGVKRVLAAGDTKGSIITDESIQVDLRVVEDASFGAALQYFTGSKEHNVALRGFARTKNLTINEYGVYKIEPHSQKTKIKNNLEKKRGEIPPSAQNISISTHGGNKPVASKTEEDVYKSLGLPFIHPALREDRGEIEAALKNKLPKLIEPKDIKGDFHVHSTYSDGSDAIAGIAERAEALGYEWIAVTDHSQSLKVARGLSVETLHRKIEEIQRLNKKLKGFRVLCGTEADILSDGSIDYPDELLKQLDWVIASIHTGFKQSEDQITGRIISAIENPHVRCIGHLTGRLLNEREAYAVNVEKVLEAAKKHGKCLEINAYPQRLDLFDIYCRKAKDMGVKLAIGTDSHSIKQFPHMELGVSVAQRGWLEKSDVLNTLTTEQLLKYINDSR